MIQVWLYDSNNIYTGKMDFVEELEKNMTDVPLLVGYIKPTFNGEEWVEGATEEEIKAWQELNKPQEPQSTIEEQLEIERKRVVCLEGENQQMQAGMSELALQLAKNILLK